MKTDSCPKPSDEARSLGLSGHVLKLTGNDGKGRETWTCIRCGQVEIRPQPFRGDI